MKLVIDILEEEYINIKNAINSLIENDIERTSMSKVCLAILNGTPLPKGHGRLIDVNDLEMDADWSDYYDGYTAYSDSMINCAPTIIEADKEEGATDNAK